MGNFKIVISGIGGHGVQRHKEDGETINFDVDGDWTIDSIAKQIAIIAKRMFSERSVAAFDAELVHWPGEEGEVRDNLITGIRTGSFNPKPKEVEQEEVREPSDVDDESEPLTEEKILEIVEESMKEVVLGDLTVEEQANIVEGLTTGETPDLGETPVVGDAEGTGSGAI